MLLLSWCCNISEWGLSLCFVIKANINSSGVSISLRCKNWPQNVANQTGVHANVQDFSIAGFLICTVLSTIQPSGSYHVKFSKVNHSGFWRFHFRRLNDYMPWYLIARDLLQFLLTFNTNYLLCDKSMPYGFKVKEVVALLFFFLQHKTKFSCVP